MVDVSSGSGPKGLKLNVQNIKTRLGKWLSGKAQTYGLGSAVSLVTVFDPKGAVLAQGWGEVDFTYTPKKKERGNIKFTATAGGIVAPAVASVTL